MVDYIRSDLDFILQQIKVAEAHAAGAPLYDPGNPNALVTLYNASVGLRTVDGSYNNLLPGQEQWGASDQPFASMVDPVYGPGYVPGANVVDPGVRTISNLIVDQTLDNPAATIEALKRNGYETNLIAIATQIKVAYQPLKPLFETAAEALEVYDKAKQFAELNPGNSDAQNAANAALQALDDANTALADARADDPDGGGSGKSFDELIGQYGIELSGANVVLPAVAPDLGLSAPANSWFTLFGQFFDHGLDLVGKGGDGIVFIPLSTDDPLYNPNSPTNFMVLTRASVSPGPDGILNDDPNTAADESADDVGPINLTSPFVDQNQTYTSHPSHQVFLRAYEMRDGRPVDTGKLIEGADGGMATWAEVKEQARTLLGINLTDHDVNMVPVLRTDAYGNFIRGPNGFPLVVTGVGTDGIPNTSDDTVVEGDPDANGGVGISLSGAVRTAHAFLDDIAHAAAPFKSNGTALAADSDDAVGLTPAGANETPTYDNELLDKHFVAGDGRVNENIGLTAVHHVFHSEHNRLADHTMDVVLADAKEMLANGATQAQAVTFLNEWLDVDVTSISQTTSVDDLTWDGDRIFQAAKFGTEMQYQHLVFEEFARKIHPGINIFVVPNGYDASIDPAIVGEFAHTVYRFGHSMLTETIDRYTSDFDADQIGLIQAFLNPIEFTSNGTVTDDIAAGDIIRGMTRQQSNHIDEHVTTALRNNLLGLPLDLAAINLARARDTGVPTLNAARAEFYEVTNQDSRLKPYESWTDFAGNLKNEASIINFIAAYGTHTLITSQTTAEGRRDAALTIITGISTGGLAVPSDRIDFLNAAGAYAGGDLGGLNNVDLWIGGLAEKVMPFGSMLGSTFGFVFETQLESLQNGDRFYYLQRLTGLHLFGELEANSFASVIQKNTNAGHLPADVFSTPGLILEVDPSKQFNDLDGDGVLEHGDPTGPSLLSSPVVRNNPATPGADSNYLQYTGAEHVLLGGTDNDDIMISSEGDDTLLGDGGNDRLQGGFGNDFIVGGSGDDIIQDIGGDDNIKGGTGNDVIHSGPGIDLVLGEEGKDFIVLGLDVGAEAFGGTGNDFILGSRNSEPIIGNEGDDWLEDGMGETGVGDNLDDVRQADLIRGNDVMIGGDGGFDEMVMEGGDDIMVASLGAAKVAGMSGFDWATYKNIGFGMRLDLGAGFVADEIPADDTTIQRFESVEGLSGTQFNDTLVGTNFTTADRGPGAGLVGGAQGSALDAQGIALIEGLSQVLRGATSYSAGDILLGGDGSDTFIGGGGNDFIDGDKWLDVRIDVHQNADGTGPIIRSVSSMKEIADAVFAGTIKPGQLTIGRYIREANGAGDTDIAVFNFNRAEYTVTRNSDGTVTVSHIGGTQADGIDVLRNIERAKFLDQTVQLDVPNAAATGAPVIGDTTPTEGQALTINTASIADSNGLGAFSYQWESSADGLSWTSIAGATAATFTPVNLAGQAFGPQADQMLRVVVRFRDGAGNDEEVVSLATAPTGVNWAGDAANNVLDGTRGDDIATGAGGADTLNGNDGNDNLNGGDGNDVLNGGDGADTLNGAGNADTITGGNGNDVITGAAGTDTAVYTLAARNYVFAESGASMVVAAAAGGTEGSDTLTTVEVLRLGGINYNVVNGTDAAATTSGNATNQVILTRGGNDIVNGAAGDDIILAGAGDDRINQSAANVGRDFVDGGVGLDTYVLTGTAAAETFQIRTRADAIANANAIDLHQNTEIVIYRNGVIIAELDNIEEITINALNASINDGNGVVNGGASAGDTIQVFGDFTQTSLDYSTITVNGGRGRDTVDITNLTSDHRIVFNTNGGTDQLIGGHRAQDVVNYGTTGAPAQPSSPAHLPDLPTPRGRLHVLEQFSNHEEHLGRFLDKVSFMRGHDLHFDHLDF